MRGDSSMSVVCWLESSSTQRSGAGSGDMPEQGDADVAGEHRAEPGGAGEIVDQRAGRALPLGAGHGDDRLTGVLGEPEIGPGGDPGGSGDPLGVLTVPADAGRADDQSEGAGRRSPRRHPASGRGGGPAPRPDGGRSVTMTISRGGLGSDSESRQRGPPLPAEAPERDPPPAQSRERIGKPR